MVDDDDDYSLWKQQMSLLLPIINTITNDVLEIQERIMKGR